MRIAFVSIPRFACAAELLRGPRLSRQPLIVGDSEQPKRVLDCSASASEAGVRPGMTLRQALGLCPGASVLPPDPVLYRRLWDAVLDALDDIAPEVEEEELGRAYLNVGGLERHYRDDSELAQRIRRAVRSASGLDATVGIAEGRFPALAAGAAATPDQPRILAPGAAAGFLAPLDVGLLPISAEATRRLRLLGIETIGEVAVLSLPELQGQFGAEGKRLWQLANGIDTQPLRPRPRQETLSGELAFEAPVAGIEVMVAAARQLLSRLRLPLRGRAVREMTLQAELASERGWSRQIVLREAVSESDRLAFVLRSVLQNSPPPQAVRSLSLRLGGLTGPTGKQLALGQKGRLQNQLEEAIRQLKARYGHSPIYRCVEVEPWSVLPEERQILVESDG